MTSYKYKYEGAQNLFIVYISVKGTYLAYSCEQIVELTSLEFMIILALSSNDWCANASSI